MLTPVIEGGSTMRRAALHLTTVCLVVGCGTGEETTPVKPSAKATGPIGTITGMVTDSQGRRVVSTTDPPVTGAIIILKGWPRAMSVPTPASDGVVLPWNKGLSPRFQGVIVNQQGRFVFTDGGWHRLRCYGDEYPERGTERHEDTSKEQTLHFEASVDIVHVACGFHVTEHSWLTVAPTPLFCPVDTEGRFVLTHHFPAGDYLLHAVSPVHGVVKGKVTIRTPGETTAVDFRFLAPDG
jgi:hypothetical protein